LLNRPIQARLLVGSSTHCGWWTHIIARWWDGICGVVGGGPDLAGVVFAIGTDVRQ
jgi:hypothetical protein